jgi:DNA-binding MarR family transcriptional regulator
MSRAARIQERRLETGLKPLGLTRITWCILLAIGNEHLTKPSEIAAFVGIDRTATSRALRQLIATGLVLRNTGANDARTREMALTDEGREILERGTPIAVANNAVMADRLGKTAVADLKALLDRLIEGEPALDKL